MTPFLRLSSIVMLVGSTFLTGCFGYDRILFVTKTNVGLDIENKPPTAEITIARRDLAIAPTFRDTTTGQDKTPPLLASFGRTGGLFSTSLTSNFAGGVPAILLARGVPPEAAAKAAATEAAAAQAAGVDEAAAQAAAANEAAAQAVAVQAAVAKAAAARAVADQAVRTAADQAMVAKTAQAEAAQAEAAPDQVTAVEAAAVEAAAADEAAAQAAAADEAEAQAVAVQAAVAKAAAARAVADQAVRIAADQAMVAKTAQAEAAQAEAAQAEAAQAEAAPDQVAASEKAAAEAKAAADQASEAEAAAVEVAENKLAAADEAAAQAVADNYKDENSSIICLDKKPDSRPPLKKIWHWMTDWIGGRPDENTRAFYFATDTVFGLKVGWDGTGGPYPTDLKLGYNRKELAFPPIFIKPVSRGECTFDKNFRLLPGIIEEGKKVEENGKFVRGYEVTIPSFFASLDNASSFVDFTKEQQLEPAEAKAAEAKAAAVEAAAVEAAAVEAAAVKEAQPEAATVKAAAAQTKAAQAAAVEAAENLAALRRELNLTHVQFFATGKAATEWVKRKKVNEKVFRQMLGEE